jgi:hypothetical protein
MLAAPGLNMQGLQPSQGHQLGQQPMPWHTWQSDQDVHDRKNLMNEMCVLALCLKLLFVVLLEKD